MKSERKGTTQVRLPDGSVVEAEFDDADPAVPFDDDRAAEFLEAARRYQDDHAELAPGRPSLTGPGTHSPHVSFRVPAELAERLDMQSAAEGVSRSVLARRALAEYLSRSRSKRAG